MSSDLEGKLPIVTIGITCFNAEDSIERAIKSALEQSWPNIEIIIVDDCSKDGSVKLVESIITHHDGVKLIKNNTNMGVGGSRKVILKKSQGEYLAFFDDDDISDRDRIKTQFDIIKSHEKSTGSELIGCYASGVRVYPNGYTLNLDAIGSRPNPPIGEQIVDYIFFNKRIEGVFYGAGTPTSALFIKKNTLIKVGGFCEQFRRVEDLDLAVRLGFAGGLFVGSKKRLYTQYATIGSDKTAEKNFKSELALIEKNKAYLGRKGRYEYCKAWFKLRYLHFSGQKKNFLKALVCITLKHPALVLQHVLKSFPARVVHEIKMKRSA